eukprot:TRINITY_DN3335_c0_g1_i1.p1 TRINITY_DN3335_c0_g1~~TRINITY_DN3335_c0_g1_i1.p1  ORF type:complete len:356 (-),score=113.04 TRINITY_DN3335_c0_g1_i1:119-1186(-)
MSHTEFYEFLAVSPTATKEEIKRAYYKKALELHPDKNPDNEGAKEKFQRLQHIYKILSSDTKRSDYDKYGENEDDEQYSEEASEHEDEDVTEMTLEKLQELYHQMHGVFLDSNSMEKKKKCWEFVDSIPNGNLTTKMLVDIFEKSQSLGMESFDFTKRNITAIPTQIQLQTTLKTLVLQHNKLSTLPDEFSHLKNLLVLNLGSNNLKKLPTPIFSLTNLEELVVEHNQIDELPGDIGNLQKLIKLNMFANKLKEIPSQLSSLKKLRSADFEINYISSIPDEVNGMMDHCEFKFDPTVKIKKGKSSTSGEVSRKQRKNTTTTTTTTTNNNKKSQEKKRKQREDPDTKPKSKKRRQK